MKPTISLIIPSYNNASYLEETLNSICTQTFADFEIILVDDGSSDHTAELVQQAATQDARIHYVYRTNGGLSAARNTGMAAAQGEYIAFVDADDILHPDYLRTLIDLARAHNADITLCGVSVFNDGEPCRFDNIDLPAQTLSSVSAVKQLLHGDFVPNVWNRLYRAELAKSRQFVPGLQLGEDMVYSAEIFSIANIVCRCDTPRYGYRKRAGSLLSAYRPVQITARLSMLRMLTECLAPATQDADFQKLFDIFVIRHIAYYGMKDLLRAPQPDIPLYRQLVAALRDEAGLTLGKLLRADVPKNIRKWVAFPLIHPWLGEQFLRYQARR